MAKDVKYPEYMRGMVPGVDFPTEEEWKRMTLMAKSINELEVVSPYEAFLELNYSGYQDLVTDR